MCPPPTPPPTHTHRRPEHISPCKCQRPHTSGSLFLNIKENNDDVLVYISLPGDFSKRVISFIMSRVCSCCRAVVKIVSTSGGCIKKKQPAAAGFQPPDLSPEWGRMSQTHPCRKTGCAMRFGLLYTLDVICASGRRQL